MRELLEEENARAAEAERDRAAASEADNILAAADASAADAGLAAEPRPRPSTDRDSVGPAEPLGAGGRDDGPDGDADESPVETNLWDKAALEQVQRELLVSTKKPRVRDIHWGASI